MLNNFLHSPGLAPVRPLSASVKHELHSCKTGTPAMRKMYTSTKTCLVTSSAVARISAMAWRHRLRPNRVGISGSAECQSLTVRRGCGRERRARTIDDRREGKLPRRGGSRRRCDPNLARSGTELHVMWAGLIPGTTSQNG